MEKKLTIKELAPYLPYGLKVMSKMGVVYELYVYYNMMGDGIEKRDLYSVLDNRMKPLLRPLSQLTQEIEHNGERFVPIDELCFIDTVEAFKEFPEQQHNLTPHIRYMDVEKLFEWHFDVFGLIDRGLAIPINGKEVKT